MRLFSRGERKENNMKKLTFALACASTLALFADITAPTADFETASGYTVDAAVPEAENNIPYWMYIASSGSTDGSTVKAYGTDVTAPTVGGDAGSNYLNLSTEGGTLWRSLAEGGNTADKTLGTAQTITDDTYVDTLVQFTANEDVSAEGVATETDDKLAIWLQKTTTDNVESYTLCVKAAQADDDGTTSTFEPKVYTLTRADGQTLTVAPSTWYRLTVKTIADCDQRVALNPSSYNTSVTGFQIYLDGALLKATTATFADGYLDLAVNANEYGWLSENDAAYALMTSATVFPSLVGAEIAATLQAVGFKGSGAIDNLLIGTDNPLPAVVTVDFTLSWADGLTPTSYQIGDADPVTTGLTSGMTLTGLTAGTAVKLYFTNADGVTKAVSATVGADVTSLTVDAAPEYTWADYLGEAVEGVYLIDSAAEFALFQKGVATLGSKDISFALSQDIALDVPADGSASTPGIGVQNAKDMVNSATEVAKFQAGAFQGTFDGGNFTLSGVVLPRTDYVGLFQSAYNATIKNLKVSLGNATGFATGTENCGGGVIAGVTVNTTIENCETLVAGEFNTFSSNKGMGGIVGYAAGGTTLKNCVNNLNITSTGNEKAGGLIACAQDGTYSGFTGRVIESCTNNGNVYCGVAGKEWTAGLVSYASSAVTIKGTCAQNGTVTGNGGKQYSIIASSAEGPVTVDANAVITTTLTSLAPSKQVVDGLNFATIATSDSGSTATFKFNAAAVAGANLKVMMGGQTITLANVGDSITLDTTLASATVTTTAENAEVTQDGNVYTVASTAVEDWPEDPANDTEIQGKTAAQAFELDETDPLAEADAVKLATWAKANSVAFADRKTAFVGEANVATVKAYLLNVAPADEATEEAAFKITSITIATDGTANVTAPSVNTAGKAFNGKVEIRGCATLTGEYNLEATNENARFFKAFILVK